MRLEHVGTAFLQLNQSAEEIAAEQPSSAEIIDFSVNAFVHLAVLTGVAHVGHGWGAA